VAAECFTFSSTKGPFIANPACLTFIRVEG
jgi:hypothetical protein